MGLSSQMWVYQDFSAGGVGRRARSRERAREGAREAWKHKFVSSSPPLCFLPPSLLPLLWPPAFSPTPARSLLPHSVTGQKRGSSLWDARTSLLGDLNALVPKPAFPRRLSLPAGSPPPGSTPQNAACSAGRGELHRADGDLWAFPLPAPRDAARSNNQSKGFQKRNVHFENFPLFPFSGVFMGPRAKDDSVLIQVLRASWRVPDPVLDVGTQGRPSRRPLPLWKSRGGHRKPKHHTGPRRPLGRVGKLSFIGCRRGNRKSRVSGRAHRVFSYPWTPFGSGPEGPGPGSG